jgi:DNA polymerase-3 subunit epsilon
VRTKHGALLDADLTARVYLELVGGRQTKLELTPTDMAQTFIAVEVTKVRQRPMPLAPRVSESEAAAHTLFIEKELGGDAIWSWR